MTTMTNFMTIVPMYEVRVERTVGTLPDTVATEMTTWRVSKNEIDAFLKVLIWNDATFSVKPLDAYGGLGLSQTTSESEVGPWKREVDLDRKSLSDDN
jgi:hypothetical protein